MIRVPHVVGPEPTSTPTPSPASMAAPSIFSPQLTQTFIDHLNQQNPNGIRFNLVAALATKPLGSIHPSFENTNINNQEKELGLELRL